jgi:ubiquinol-cytochrome c reductase subunit 8
MRQRGIITYGLSSNAQNPVAGAFHDAIFNVWRRFSKQVLYFAPPMVFFYYAMDWAVHRYVSDIRRGRSQLFADRDAETTT